MAGPTNFLESNALLALMAEDEVGAAKIIANLLPGERHALSSAAYGLCRLCSMGHAETVLLLAEEDSNV